MSGRVDIAVVGAGIVGCMIARELVARAPEASVVVLDRDAIGSGASRRSAGLHLPRGGTPEVRRMTQYSQDYYAELRRSDPALPIHPSRLSVVAAAGSGPKLRDTYLDSARLTRTDGVPGAAGIRVPERAESWRGGGCQHADVQALTLALARQLRPRVTFREGVQVTGIDTVGGGVVLRLGTGDTLAADRVVLAPGPWLAAPAWCELLAPQGVRVKKVIAMHVERTPAEDDRVVVFEDEDAFLLPLRTRGHWLYSYTCQEWDVDPDEPSGGLAPHQVRDARESLGRYAPGLVGHCFSGRVFCDAYSATGSPLVRALDGDGRIVFAGAANGSGYRLAPAIAAAAADVLKVAVDAPNLQRSQA